MRPRPDHIRMGVAAEDRAVGFLENQGLTILRRNFRVRGGEIDMIAKDNQELVFVEVRWRKNRLFGGAVESINHHKLRRIQHAAACYLQSHRLNPGCRIDLLCQDGRGAQFEWLWIRGLL